VSETTALDEVIQLLKEERAQLPSPGANCTKADRGSNPVKTRFENAHPRKRGN